MRKRGATVALLLGCLGVALALLLPQVGAARLPDDAHARPRPKPKLIDVQLLSINDFHGNIQPPGGSSGRINTPDGPVDAGGVEYLATHIEQLEATNPNTVVVAAGDLIGARPAHHWLRFESGALREGERVDRAEPMLRSLHQSRAGWFPVSASTTRSLSGSSRGLGRFGERFADPGDDDAQRALARARAVAGSVERDLWEQGGTSGLDCPT